MDDTRDRRARGRVAAWPPLGPGLLVGALLALPAAAGARGLEEADAAGSVALLALPGIGIAAGVALRPGHRRPMRERAFSVLACAAAALVLTLAALAPAGAWMAVGLLVTGLAAGWGLPRGTGGRTPVVAALGGLLIGVAALSTLTAAEGLPGSLSLLAGLAALAAATSAVSPPSAHLRLARASRPGPRAPLCELALAAAAIGVVPVAGIALAETRGWPVAAAGLLLGASGLAGALLAASTVRAGGPAPGGALFGVARTSAPVVASTAAMAAAASTGVTAALAPLVAATFALAVGPWAAGRLRPGDLALAGAAGPLVAAGGLAAGGAAAALAALAALPLAAWAVVALTAGSRPARRARTSGPRERIAAALAEAAPTRDPSSPRG